LRQNKDDFEKNTYSLEVKRNEYKGIILAEGQKENHLLKERNVDESLANLRKAINMCDTVLIKSGAESPYLKAVDIMEGELNKVNIVSRQFEKTINIKAKEILKQLDGVYIDKNIMISMPNNEITKKYGELLTAHQKLDGIKIEGQKQLEQMWVRVRKNYKNCTNVMNLIEKCEDIIINQVIPEIYRRKRVSAILDELSDLAVKMQEEEKGIRQEFVNLFELKEIPLIFSGMLIPSNQYQTDDHLKDREFQSAKKQLDEFFAAKTKFFKDWKDEYNETYRNQNRTKFQKEITELKKEREELKKIIEIANQINQDNSGENQDKGKEIRNLRDNLKVTEQALADYQKQGHELKKNIQDRDETILKLSKDLQETNERLNSRIQNLEKEVSQLKANAVQELSKFKNLELEFNVLQDSFIQKGNNLNVLSLKHDQLNVDLQLSQEALKKATERLEPLEKKVKIESELKDGLAKQNFVLQEELKKLKGS
jgi:hypothetical protein